MTIYSEDFRLCVIENALSGVPRSEILWTFGIGSNTLTRWLRWHRNGIDMSTPLRGRYTSKKLDDAALLDYIKNNNDSVLEEIAAHFNVCAATIFNRLNVLGVTRKKNHVVRRAGRGKTRKVSSRNHEI
jgi:hypothetical protein